MKSYLFCFGIGLALAASMGVAHAVTCTPAGNTVTCTGGAGASINIANTTGTQPGTPFPTTINVTGGSGTVQSMTLTLHTYTSAHSGTQHSSRDMGLLLVSPGGRNMEVLRCPGAAGFPQTGINVTLQDGGTVIPSCNTGDANVGTWNTSGTFAPAAYLDNVNAAVNYAQAGAPALQAGHTPANQGSATLNSTNDVFTGDTTNGNWSLYLVDDATDGASVSFASWDISITFSAASTPSTTTLSPNPTTAFTSAANSSVVLTATVTTGATGTVTFKEGNTTLTCSQGAQPRPLSGGNPNQAVCTTTFAAEGFHSLSAGYSGDGTFVPSTGNANVYTQNHATNVGTVYCNTGAINGDGRADLGFTHTNTYPSVIFVGDGTNTDIPNQVNTVSVQFKNFQVLNGTTDMHMLLVAPDGTHALDFWGDAGAGGTNGSGNYTLIDGSPILPNNTAISPGTYGPTSYFNTDVFTPAPPPPAPQPPGSFSLATPAGSSNFQTAFVGANAHGAWKLFMFNDSGSGDTTTLSGGWCLNIQPATGNPTTVTVNSNPFPNAVKGNSVTFTATIASSPAVGNTGQVTFTENGAALVGAPNGGVSSVVNGVATTSTTQLPEGDHTITASYHDSTNTFNDNFGTVTMRVDANTATPTLSGSTWSYCNPSGIVIPRGVNFVDDIGAAAPNPSNIFVTNLPGTINSVGLTLKSFHVTSPGDLDSLLVGPKGASVPTKAQTLDFFTGAGGNGGSTAFMHDTTFLDGQPAVSCTAGGPAPGASAAPTSCVAVTPSYFASPFYTLPGTFQRAATGGAFTLDTGTYTPNVGGGVYKNVLPNGTWSLYFNQNIHHSGDGATSWCMNFTENPVTVTASKGHTGRPPNGHFQQGHSGASFMFTIKNNGDSNGLGSTGDPDGLHPLTVVDMLDATAFTPGTLPTGTPWNCTAVTNTVTCKSSLSIASGSSYPVLTIPVIVKNAAPASASNQGSLSGGGITAPSPPSDMVVIDPAPFLAITKAHTGTFTQGQTATWTLQVTNNSATTAGNTDGTTVTVTDTLPTGYTLSSGTGTGWTCISNTNVVSCTSSDVVNGSGGMFNIITLVVNVPANSPTSISNSGKVFGGGDVVHVDAGTSAASNNDAVTVIQVPASIAVSSGNNQNVATGAAYAALKAIVKDAANVVIPNVGVTFTANVGGTGATGGFAASPPMPVATDAGGIATAPTLTANGSPGAFTVTATVNALTAPFNLRNIVNTPPTSDSVTGIAPGSLTQTLTFKYSSVNGYGYLSFVYALFNSSLTGTGGCWPFYDQTTNAFFLAGDGTTVKQGPLTPGTSGNLSNGQCTLQGTGSSVSGSGNTLTVIFNVTFSAGFGASHTIYMYAQDAGNLNSGWQTKGTTAGSPNTPPTADSVTGVTLGSLTQPSLVFKYSSANGAAYLMDTYALFNGSLNGVNACWVFYDRSANGFYLVNDAQTALLGPLAQNAAGTLANTQCTLNGTGSNISQSGNTLTMNLNVTFSAGFGAAQSIFMYAADANGLNSGWQSNGTTGTAAAPTADSVTGMTPGALAQSLTFKYSSANGYKYLNDVHALFNATLNGANACWIFYDKGMDGWYLINDTATAYLGPLARGSSSTLTNNQCTLNGTGSTVTGSGNTLTMVLNVTFSAGFGAGQNIFMYASDEAGQNSGWVNKGTTASSVPPTADTVTGMVNASATQSLVFKYSSPNGANYLGEALALVNTGLGGMGACWVFYNKPADSFYLANDAGSAYLGPLARGSSGTLMNSQCTLNGTGSTVSTAGNTLTMTLNLTFTGLHGAESIFMYASDAGGMTSGWQNRGTVTLP